MKRLFNMAFCLFNPWRANSHAEDLLAACALLVVAIVFAMALGTVMHWLPQLLGVFTTQPAEAP
jgi:hypothetical protein